MDNDITEIGQPLTLQEILVLIDIGMLDFEDDTDNGDNDDG